MAKKNVVQFRATDTEYAVLTLAAREAGITVSDFVREKLFGVKSQVSAVAELAEVADVNPVTRLDGEPIYRSHPKNCECFLCNSARSAGLKK
jgi:hypothetical protein